MQNDSHIFIKENTAKKTMAKHAWLF